MAVGTELVAGYTEAPIAQIEGGSEHSVCTQEQLALRSEDEGGVERGAVCYSESSVEAAWDG